MNNIVKPSFEWYELIISHFIHPSSPPELMMDIGVGPKSEYLQLSRRFPEMDLVGLEPNPRTYREVLPKFPGQLKQLAITQDGSPATYTVHRQNVMASGLIPYDSKEENLETFTVDGTTLDLLDEEFGFRSNILLWMDIEGYELKALQSGPELLRSGRVKWINLEVRERWNRKKDGCTESEVDEYLGKLGYIKCFAYNHYPSSHHHDAIYVLQDEELPETGRQYRDFYYDQLAIDYSQSSRTNLAMANVDMFLAVEELKAKVAYLRAQILKSQ